MYAWYNALLCGIYATLLIVVILFILSFFFRNRRWAYILWNMKLCYFPFLIFLMAIFALIIMFNTFNNGDFFISGNTKIPVDIGKWGNFTTFLGGIFALISISFAYRAFRIQTDSASRTSFDATFTQIFSQHHILHEKVLKHNIEFTSRYNLSSVVSTVDNNIFSICRNEYRKSIGIGLPTIDVSCFWDDFNRWDIVDSVSIDFKNYFKYIYHEINIVVSQPYEVLDDDAKRRYIQLIQAQMNYDELFCYLINQVEYLSYWERNQIGNKKKYDRAKKHVENLRKYGFFEELCKSRSEYVDLVRRIFNHNHVDTIPNDNIFVRNDWFCV